MKFLSIFATVAFAVAASAAPGEGNNDASVEQAKSAAATCVDNACVGFGGEELCNDRCRNCYGPSGYYSRGECCGFGWQTCCCYYG